MGRTLTRNVALGVFLLLGACADDSPVRGFEVSGFVRDASTEAGIGGATIRFQSDTLFDAETTTDGDGFYQMNVETDRPFAQIRAEAAGYEPSEETVFFDTEIRRVDLLMRTSSRE